MITSLTAQFLKINVPNSNYLLLSTIYLNFDLLTSFVEEILRFF